MESKRFAHFNVPNNFFIQIQRAIKQSLNLRLVADADDQKVSGKCCLRGLHQHQGGFVIKLVGGFCRGTGFAVCAAVRVRG